MHAVIVRTGQCSIAAKRCWGLPTPARKRQGLSCDSASPPNCGKKNVLAHRPRNATLFDSPAGTLKPYLSIVVGGYAIADVAATPAAGDAQVLGLARRTLLPGLIDGQLHVTATIPTSSS